MGRCFHNLLTFNQTVWAILFLEAHSKGSYSWSENIHIYQALTYFGSQAQNMSKIRLTVQVLGMCRSIEIYCTYGQMTFETPLFHNQGAENM
jgi:hypothetical protein